MNNTTIKAKPPPYPTPFAGALIHKHLPASLTSIYGNYPIWEMDKYPDNGN
jgi:hypothetical protein